LSDLNGFNSELSRRQLLARGGAGFAAFSLAGLLAACGGGGGGTSGGAAVAARPKFVSPRGGGKPVPSISWAIYDDLVSTDYAFSYDFNTNCVVTNVVDSLLRVSPDGKLLPNLATSWKRVDPLTYVYQLRQGVKFHDGTEMTAADAAASLNRLLDPKVGTYLSVFVAHVKSAQATSRYELTVKLAQPDALWDYAPATSVGAVSSKAFLDRHGKDVGSPSVGILGTGPYRFVSWAKGQQAVIERNPHYWNPARQPKVERITFKVISDEATVIEAMGNGSINGAFNISGRNLAAVKRFPSIRVGLSPSYFVHFLGLNTTRAPFTDKRVRQALSYAIDKPGILASTWGGQGEVVKSPSTPAMWGYEPAAFKSAYAKLPDFGLDMAKAKSLVKAAGATGASATILVATPHEKDEGLAVQEAAKKIGIDIRLQSIPYTQLLAKIASKQKDYDGFILEWSSDYPDPAGTLSQCFLSSSSVDYTKYANPKVDQALNESGSLTDPARRAQLLSEAQAQIVDDQSWIVFFSPYTNMPMTSNIGGYQLRPLWYWDSWAADLSGT
jgi:peptide/nickel transport system substrate-binding protein